MKVGRKEEILRRKVLDPSKKRFLVSSSQSSSFSLPGDHAGQWTYSKEERSLQERKNSRLKLY